MAFCASQNRDASKIAVHKSLAADRAKLRGISAIRLGGRLSDKRCDLNAVILDAGKKDAMAVAALEAVSIGL